MAKKTIGDIAISATRLLIRVNLNVAFREDGSVAGDRRLRGAFRVF
jgi:3-phosphoglycerate kinase